MSAECIVVVLQIINNCIPKIYVRNHYRLAVASCLMNAWIQKSDGKQGKGDETATDLTALFSPEINNTTGLTYTTAMSYN